jgi:hypothetical protein
MAPRHFVIRKSKTNWQLRSLGRGFQPLLDCLGREKWVGVEEDVGRMLDCQPPDDNASC